MRSRLRKAALGRRGGEAHAPGVAEGRQAHHLAPGEGPGEADDGGQGRGPAHGTASATRERSVARAPGHSSFTQSALGLPPGT